MTTIGAQISPDPKPAGHEHAPLVVVIGDLNVDLTFTLPTFPREGDDIPARELGWQSGGAGVNTATAFARLGARVRLLGRVGRDPTAEVALGAAQRDGVILDYIQRDDEVATGLCGVLVGASGQRTFVSYRGANARCSAVSLDALLEGCTLLFICGHALLEGAQRQTTMLAIEGARERAIPIALDLCLPTIRAAQGELIDLLPKIWLLSTNEDELEALLPGVGIAVGIEQLLEAGTHHVVIKRGAQGCSAAEGTRRLEALPPPVAAIDTNGCGDAFAAGYTWALLRGADIAARATLANLMGALTAKHAGAAEALPTHAELASALETSLHHLITPA